MKLLSLPTVRRLFVGGILLALVSQAVAGTVQPLDGGWEFYLGALGSIWEIWRDDQATDNVNCRQVELFVNGISAGVKERNSADFPAAGLRWNVQLNEGANTLRAVGTSAGAEVADQIPVAYQTASWGPPATLALKEISRNQDIVTLEARAFDRGGVPCLDAANLVRFGLTGDARLLDNLGPSTGSRVVQLYNGLAQISLQLKGEAAVASVSSGGIKTEFLKVEKRQ